MNMTPSVHSTANFMRKCIYIRGACETYAKFVPTTLADWHRYYIWAYENALRTECGYKGYQPYWDCKSYTSSVIQMLMRHTGSKYPDIVNSPIFNGDEWSMGGNGDPVPHSGMDIGLGATIPAGPGGGCVTTGPFVK
jgi:tyrosinase